MSEETTIHALSEGQPLCKFSSDIPENWPTGHKWLKAEKENVEKITCITCRARARAILFPEEAFG